MARPWFLLLVLMVCAAFAQAQVPVTDDAFTSSAAPNANYGISLGLVVQSSTASGLMLNPAEAAGASANTYLKFDLSALPPNVTVANLSKANLRLYVDFVVSPGTFDVYLAAAPWNEGTLTANNAPGIVGVPLNPSPISVTKALKYIDIDITAAFANGAPSNGVVLMPSKGSTIFASFDSKENPITSHDPELSVSVNDASSAQLQQEITRATQAENTIGTNLSSETTRATGAENTLNNGLNAEVARAQKAEGVLGNSVSNETARAQSAESVLSTGINNEIANRVVGDTKALNSATAYTDASVATEATLRAGADNTLQSNITAVQNSLGNYAQVNAPNKFTATQIINGDLSVNNVNAAGELTAGGGALLPAVQTATPAQGFPSNNFDLAASLSDGSNSYNETFRWQAVPVNNGTPKFAAQLNLLYGGGVTPVATGFSFNADGSQNFVPNQIFNGTHTGDGSGLKNINALTANTAASATTAVSAATATNFSGALAGDVAGTQSSTVVSALAGVPLSTSPPKDGQVLVYNAAANQWQAASSAQGSGNGSAQMMASAFLPGPLSAPFTASTFTPGLDITLTRITAEVKTASDSSCVGGVLRVGNAAAAQDLTLVAAQNTIDSGVMALPLSANTPVTVKLQSGAMCSGGGVPADANVQVQYRMQASGETVSCAASGQACMVGGVGVCTLTQTDVNNCGACGNVCTSGASCIKGACSRSKLTTSLNVPLPTPSSLSAGQSVQLFASMGFSAPAGVPPPTGFLTFADGGTSLGTAPLTSGFGQLTALLTVVNIAAGTHSITAQYQGDGNYNSSISGPLSLVAVKTDVSLSSYPPSPSSPSAGQSVQLFATMGFSAPAGVAAPTGSVTFLDGGTSLGTVPLASGGGQLSAVLTLPNISAGTHSITVQYAGDGNYNGGTSAAINFAVPKTNVSLSSYPPSPSSPSAGQSVQLFATMGFLAPAGVAAPTGSATFLDGGTSLGTVPLASGGGQLSAVLTLPNISAGTHSITVQYAGDGNYNGGTSAAINFVVLKTSTSIFMPLASPSSPTAGQSVQLITNLGFSAQSGVPPPTGSVTFLDGGAVLGTTPLVNDVATGQLSAQFTVQSLGSGSHSFSVQYAGDANYSGSSSTALGMTVN